MLRASPLIAMLLTAIGGGLRADDGLEFFEQKVRPVLIERCYKCHPAEARISNAVRDAGLQINGDDPAWTLLDYQPGATVLHLLGIDHERATYRYSDRDFRLTDVHGQVVQQILA